MADTTQALENAAWAAAYAVANAEQVALLHQDRAGWQRALERLLQEADAQLAAVNGATGEEPRGEEPTGEEPTGEEPAIELAGIRERLGQAHERLTTGGDEPVASLGIDPPGEARLQASWSAGQVVVWAGGPGADPADNDQLSDRLEAVGGPPRGWNVHADVVLPGGARGASLSIPMADALGWLVSVGGGEAADGVGLSVRWLGRVTMTAVKAVAQGRVVPLLQTTRRANGKRLELAVRWGPAVLDDTELTTLAASMPGAVVAVARADARSVILNVIGAAVDAIVREAAGKLELPAPPPSTHTAKSVSEAVMTRLDGSAFEAPVAAGAEIAKRLDRWTKPVAGVARARLVIQLEPPDRDDAWFLSVLGEAADGRLVPVEVAVADARNAKAMADELARLERALPVLLRPGGIRTQRRGQVYLSQDEAWDLMTVTGPALEAAGFDVRVPRLSRRKPKPALRLFTEPVGETVVGARQLSDVTWSVVFDDVELTAADVSRLAAEAKPLVQSRGRWVELDRADLKEAAAALAERATTTRLSGGDILRHAVGLESSPLEGGFTIEGTGWATDLLRKAQDVPMQAPSAPKGFRGELRHYQAEALAWLGFLDTVGLGGCLALDMGLGKTPTVLAQIARTLGSGPVLVVAPAAVVGNWAAEAARFTPGLRVVIHHGTARASADELEAEVAGADVIITTYGTAVRDIDAIAAVEWDRLVLDEAQAIKNPASDTAQQLRRVNARSRVALTGTPIENGLGDLWAILDFTNPGLVGSRTMFISQLSGEGEAALRALNGILVFRRTKLEPVVAAELPDRIDELDHCTMTREQIGLYQAVLDSLVVDTAEAGGEPKKGAILAAITALKQICNHPAAYQADDQPLAGRSGKLARLEEIIEAVFSANERILVFTHFAEWGQKMAAYLTETTGVPIVCYHGGLARGKRDRIVADFQGNTGPGALVLSLKAGGTGLNLTAASHVVLYDRWWNPAVEDQARDRAWRIGQTRTVVSHRLVCPGTVDERVEEVVAGKRHIADLVLPKSSSLADLDADQLRTALGLQSDALLTADGDESVGATMGHVG